MAPGSAFIDNLIESYEDCEFVRHFGEEALRRMKAAKHGLSIWEPEPGDGALSMMEDDSGRLVLVAEGQGNGKDEEENE